MWHGLNIKWLAQPFFGLSWHCADQSFSNFNMCQIFLEILLKYGFWLSRSGVESKILPFSQGLRRCWYCWSVDHSLSSKNIMTASGLHKRREARDATCLQERISTCKAMFLMLQAKEMQQMVKLEAEMDRRPATVVWNSKMQTEVAKPHSIKSSLPNFWTHSPWKKIIVFCVSFMYRQDVTQNHRLTYFSFTFWILNFLDQPKVATNPQKWPFQ